jgi:hypothetical protein
MTGGATEALVGLMELQGMSLSDCAQVDGHVKRASRSTTKRPDEKRVAFIVASKGIVRCGYEACIVFITEVCARQQSGKQYMCQRQIGVFRRYSLIGSREVLGSEQPVARKRTVPASSIEDVWKDQWLWAASR